MTKANEARWSHRAKHHDDIRKVLESIIAKERFDSVMNDGALTKAIMERGVWCTKSITHKVRVQAGIPASDQRRITLFAKQHKSKK